MSAIINQLKTWNFLVEERMKFEEIIQKCNSLPQFNVRNEFINAGGDKLLKNKKNAQNSLFEIFKELVLFNSFIDNKNLEVLNESNSDLEKYSESDENEDYLDYEELEQDEKNEKVQNNLEYKEFEQDKQNEQDENNKKVKNNLEYEEFEQNKQYEQYEQDEQNEQNEQDEQDGSNEKFRRLSQNGINNKMIAFYNEFKFEKDYNDSVLDIENYLDKHHIKITNIRDDILNFWFKKTRSTLKGGKLDKSSMDDFEQSIVKSISHVMLNRLKLIKRTQLKRGNYTIFGKLPEINLIEKSELLEKKNKEYYDTEIFDDSDFYHQLLRELVNSLGPSTINNSLQINSKWIKLIRERFKLKKPVDIKATKARKIRYKVHDKLVNFMTPLKYLKTYDEQQTNNLINSLFGKKTIINNQKDYNKIENDSDSE